MTDDNECWLLIVDFPDYSVSSFGRVMRTAPSKDNARRPGSIITASCNSGGYATLGLYRNGIRTTKTVARLVCSAFHGMPPGLNYHVAHNDGDKRNNNKNNLRWATPVENERDKKKHGTAAVGDRHGRRTKPEFTARGEKAGGAKLTADAVRAIRADTRKLSVLAEIYGVDQSNISCIRRGVTWRHVS